MTQDVLTFTILDDGTVRTETDKVSGANHASADALLKGIQTLLGGATDVKRKVAHAHVHAHHQHKADS